MSNYIDLIARLMPTVFRGHFGSRLAGVVGGLYWSILAEKASEAVKSPWVQLNTNPDDSLPLLGNETLLEAYPGETPSNHRARIRRAWDDLPFAGDESTIAAQFAAAGYAGVQVRFYPGRPGPAGEADYWSQFWIWFPQGSHTVTAGAPIVGSFNVGDGTLVGVVGLTPAQLLLFRSIARKWKPGHWICRGWQFDAGGAVVGGFNVGDGTVVGGLFEASF